MNYRSYSEVPPVISIVVPAYNCRHFILDTLDSIQAQTFPDWECIVVDDGSTDDTLSFIQAVAAGDSRFHVATQLNGGPASARNHGLRLTDPRSRYITFMDSDDTWLPQALDLLKAEIEPYPDAVGVHALGHCIDEFGSDHEDSAYAGNGNGRFICSAFGAHIPLDPSAPTSFQSLWFSNPYPPGLVLTRRAAYGKAGAFDPAICPVEDSDMLIRLSRHGDFRFIPRVLLSYRRHANNLSGQSSTLNSRQIRALLYKTFFSPDNSPAHRLIVQYNWRAGEMMHLRQRWQDCKKQFAEHNPRQLLTAFAAIFAHLYRFLRGSPGVVQFANLHPASSPASQPIPDPLVSHSPT
jgi:glycosyltransferase involved in cell wall biosynthesis